MARKKPTIAVTDDDIDSTTIARITTVAIPGRPLDYRMPASDAEAVLKMRRGAVEWQRDGGDPSPAPVIKRAPEAS